MYRKSSTARKSFKPPSRTSAGSGVPLSDEVSSNPPKKDSMTAKDDLKTLKAKEAELDEEIRKLQDKGMKAEQLQEYINLLHEYNEVKDVAQMFLGRLAVYECVTYKEIAGRYNAPESE